jgi:peptidyl-prolyl cis-trans isomerase D
MTARKSGPNFLVWVLMAMLLVGLAGFGIGNFGGATRNIGTVGTVEITVDDYAEAFDRARRRVTEATGEPLSVAEALAQEIDALALADVVSAAALDNEAARIGLSVGDGALQAELRAVPAFAGPDGTFDRDAYRLWLDNRGMTAAALEAGLRADIARALLVGAVAGKEPRPAYVALLREVIGERRDFIWAPVTVEQLAEPVPEPTEAQIAAYYDAHPEDFTAPERRQITFAALTPAMMVDSLTPDEAALRTAYDARAEIYNIPERRLVERLVFDSMDAALAARAALDAGETDLAALAAERDLTLADVDLGDVRRSDLSSAAAAAVFAIAEPGIVGPVDSALGPALFRVNAILAPQVTPFEAVREDLLAEVMADDALREIAMRREAIADIIAGGATLEDLATETAMALGTAELPGDPLVAPLNDPAFQEAVANSAPGDFPVLAELDDGGLFALRVDAVVPPALMPLDTVRAAATAGWRAEETRQRLAALGAQLLARLEAGESFTALGLEPRDERGRARGDRIEGAPLGLLASVFALAPGGDALVEGDPPALVRLTAILPPDPDDPALNGIVEALGLAAAQGRADDIARLYAEAMQLQAETRIDPQVVDAVNAQLR